MNVSRIALIVFGGLPGTGKTTAARALASRMEAIYLRIDTIEVAIKRAGIPLVGAAGYTVAQALAAENLALGHAVVADCVNPVGESRKGWRGVAREAGARIVEIILVCSDLAEHRRRIEEREADIPGLVVPDWAKVIRHEVEPWDKGGLTLETAGLTPTQVLALCEDYVAARRMSADE